MDTCISKMAVGIVLSAVFATGMNAHAAVIAYDESIDGSLGAISTNVGTLDLGINTISGSLGGTPPTDVDNFDFILPVHLDIVSIVLSFDSLQNGEVINAGLRTSANNLFDDNFGQVTGGSSIVASLMDTFGPETGALAGPNWFVELNGSVLFNALDWQLTVTTMSNGNGGGGDPVPEPGTLALMGLTVAGLAYVRRRNSV